MNEEEQILGTELSTKSSLKSVDIVRAIHDFEGDNENTLKLSVNDTVSVLNKGSNGWWDGVIEEGGQYIRGWFPSSYVKSIVPVSQFSRILKKSLSGGVVTHSPNTGSYPSSRRNSGTSIDSSINIDQEKPVSTETRDSPQSEINILSADEVNTLCNRFLAQTNEPPVWVPQLTDDGVLIYYNERFNVYARNLPLTTVPTIDADSLLKFPNRNTLNKLDNVVVPKDDESLEKLNYTPVQNLRDNNDFPEVGLQQSSQRSQQQTETSGQRQDSVKSLHNNSLVGEEPLQSINNALFSSNDLFYTDPTDMTTWYQLHGAFVFVIDASLDALSKSQNALFSSYYNKVTQLCTLFQLAARLVQHELVAQNLDYSIQSKLKKMTNSVAELGINGDLHLSLQSRSDSIVDDVASSNSDTVSIDEPYLEKAKNNVKSLKHRADQCYKIYSSLKYDDPNHDTTLLPQIYPRFMKDVFDGGNWSNPLFLKKKSPFKINRKESTFGRRPRYYQDRLNRPKILLDKDAINTLEGKKSKLTKILGDLISTLDSQPPEGVNLTKFKNERNITVLTVVYDVLQPASRVMDILESFDFSVFKAAKQIPLFKEQSENFSNPQESTDPKDVSSEAESGLFEKDAISYTYPMLIEFFEYKQELYDALSELIMDAQGLTLDDPELFKSIREDDNSNGSTPQLATEQLALRLKMLLIENDISTDNDGLVQFKKDDKLRESIHKLGTSLGMILYSVQQLINERESVLNYSSRNMNIEFDVSLFMGERHSTMPDLSDEYRNDDVSHARRSSKNIPWYLDVDEDEYSIIYDSKGNVKGGSIDGLVSHLTSNGERDPDFIGAFLLTFRSFISPSELISKLEARYEILPPEGLSFEEYNTWIEKKLKIVRINTMTVIWLLLTRYWNYFYYTAALMDQIKKFVERVSTHIVPNKQDYYDKINQLTEVCKRRTPNSVGSSYKIETIQNTTPPPPPILKGSSLRRIKLRDIDPLEMARQLTIREFAFYSRITEAEFLDKVWGDKYSHLGSSINIKYFISYANKLTNFISFMIIKHKDAKKRAETIVYFIKTCEKCLMMKNYSSLTAMISALSSSPIARLKKTWAQVPKTYTETFNRLDKLMSIDRNYNEYRDLLKFVKENEPCIPFLGIYLTDLTFVSQAISDHIDRDRKIINFYKRYKIYYTITESLKYERAPYNFQIVHEIQSFLDNWFSVSPDVNDQHKLSLSLEPRIVPNAH